MDTIQFLNDLLLAVFLYATFFTLGALFVFETQETTPAVPDYRTAFAEENDPEPVEPQSELLPKPQETPAASGVLSRIISELKQTQLRKLCRPLGIQQKRNGVSLSTELMRAEIQRQVKQQPKIVLQILKEKLPEVLPATTNLQSA